MDTLPLVYGLEFHFSTSSYYDHLFLISHPNTQISVIRAAKERGLPVTCEVLYIFKIQSNMAKIQLSFNFDMIPQ